MGIVTFVIRNRMISLFNGVNINIILTTRKA